MRKFAQSVLGFLANTRAATAIEYGLIASIIAVAALAGMSAFGGGLAQFFNAAGERAGVIATVTEAPRQ